MPSWDEDEARGRSRRLRSGPGKGVMADSFSSKLQLWDGWARSVEGTAPSSSLPMTPLATEHPDHLFARETLGPAGQVRPEGVEPFSLQWFLDIENLRH